MSPPARQRKAAKSDGTPFSGEQNRQRSDAEHQLIAACTLTVTTVVASLTTNGMSAGGLPTPPGRDFPVVFSDCFSGPVSILKPG
jgi:hypothetical protein